MSGLARPDAVTLAWIHLGLGWLALRQGRAAAAWSHWVPVTGAPVPLAAGYAALLLAGHARLVGRVAEADGYARQLLDGGGAVSLPRPFPTDVGLAHQGHLTRVHAEEAGGEPSSRFLVVLLGGVGQRGRRADTDDLVGLLPRQGH